MSFRTRLISFFLVIVLIPMLAVGVLVFRLIDDSGQAKAQARANGLLTSAASVYAYDQTSARDAATTLARVVPTVPSSQLRARLVKAAAQAGLERLQLLRQGKPILDIGNRTAVAPGIAAFHRGATTITVRVSEITADQFVSGLGLGSGVIVRQGARVLSSNVENASAVRPAGSTSVDGASYQAATSAPLPGFSAPVRLTVLSPSRSTGASVRSSRVLAAAFIVGFLLLALAFAVIASRGLQSQLSAFLRAARRLGSGDFSAPIPVHGNDEFAMLAREFNGMSKQLAERMDQLQTERARLRESIRRAGATFASNLDREGLLTLAMKTAMDAVEAEFGRLSVREQVGDPLVEVARENTPDDIEEAVLEAERKLLQGEELAEAEQAGVFIASAPLGAAGGVAKGLLTVGRRGRGFSSPDLTLLRSLAWQATLALENVELHEEVQLQAVTDKLTGLINHGRFQETLGSEMDQVRRYHYPVGLIMLDIDNFKQINDTYGHQQGDRVLQGVARVLSETSREADSASRYGGEEMAVILPHTDLEGSYAIAERIRTAVCRLRIPLLNGDGLIRLTASLGVAVTAESDKNELINEADMALYQAKRDGKNRTVRAALPADVTTGE